eukprot:4004644-Pleurochrysis_carterae.AAC.3
MAVPHAHDINITISMSSITGMPKIEFSVSSYQANCKWLDNSTTSPFSRARDKRVFSDHYKCGQANRSPSEYN